MILTRFVKTGEVNYYEDDGDLGFETEVDIPDEDVKKALVDIISDCYFNGGNKEQIKVFVDDIDLNILVDLYKDNLEYYFFG